MGGSGGDFFPSLSDRTRSGNAYGSESETQRKEHEKDVSNLITSLLSEFSNRDIELIQGHLKTIKDALEKDIEGTVEILFGGSVAKHTYVDGLSDIDVLVCFDNTSLAGKSATQVKQYFFDRLSQRLPKTEKKIGDLAVTLNFQKAEIQLLPAIKTNSGFKISTSTGEEWSAIKPKSFAQKLTQVNQRNANKVIPVIKLAKSVMSDLPKEQRLSGYHAEAVAVEVFRSYSGSSTPKNMLKHYFEKASTTVLKPIKDKTGQSIHVDDHLGAADSDARKRLSSSLARIGRRMSNADMSLSLDQWKNILE